LIILVLGEAKQCGGVVGLFCEDWTGEAKQCGGVVGLFCEDWIGEAMRWS